MRERCCFRSRLLGTLFDPGGDGDVEERDDGVESEESPRISNLGTFESAEAMSGSEAVGESLPFLADLAADSGCFDEDPEEEEEEEESLSLLKKARIFFIDGLRSSSDFPLPPSSPSFFLFLPRLPPPDPPEDDEDDPLTFCIDDEEVNEFGTNGAGAAARTGPTIR